MSKFKYLLLAGLACLSMQVQAKTVTNTFYIGTGPFHLSGNPHVTPLKLSDIVVVGDDGMGKFTLKTLDPNGGYEKVFYWWNPTLFPEEMKEEFYWGNSRGEPEECTFASGQGFFYTFTPGMPMYVKLIDRNTWRLYDQEEDIP